MRVKNKVGPVVREGECVSLQEVLPSWYAVLTTEWGLQEMV
jgi:hypothetical protein